MTVLKVQERGDEKPKQLRRLGIVPIGLVERGKPTRKVQADAHDLRHALTHTSGARMLELMVDGEPKARTVIVKQVDSEPVTGRILTVTFAEISRNEVITADVPVTHTGTPPAVEDGTAVLMHPTSHVKLHGKAIDLPASVSVDISALELGHHVNAGDVTLPAGVDLVSSPDATLFSVQILRIAEPEAEVAAEETAPEGAEGPPGDSSAEPGAGESE